MTDEKRRFYGVAVPSGSDPDLQGGRILSRFVLEICGSQASGTRHHIEDSIAKSGPGSARPVLLGSLGRCGSSVWQPCCTRPSQTAACRVRGHGLCACTRPTSDRDLRQAHGRECHRVDAEARFLKALAGVADPESQAQDHGRVFVEILRRRPPRSDDAKWLAQGTIYPDVIDPPRPAAGPCHQIPPHVGGLPAHMRMQLVGRCGNVQGRGAQDRHAVGSTPRHGLPPSLPGPGLGVRILGE